jgi:hypothetical protein
MNLYLQKLRALRAEVPIPQTHRAGTKEGFEGFEGDGGTGFSGPESAYPPNPQNPQNPLNLLDRHTSPPPFGRLNRFCRIFAALEARSPDHVLVERWQHAVEDGRRFLARWGEQAEALGWTPKDLFGLQTPPEKPHPSYCRLSRYDETGLIWLLCGREVVALTEATAAIQNPTGAITIYRRQNRPALGPIGDSLHDLEPPFDAA